MLKSGAAAEALMACYSVFANVQDAEELGRRRDADRMVPGRLPPPVTNSTNVAKSKTLRLLRRALAVECLC